MALGIMRSRGVAWQHREGSATLLAPGGGLCLVCGVLAVWVCFSSTSLDPAMVYKWSKSHCCYCQQECSNPTECSKEDSAVQATGSRVSLSLLLVLEDGEKDTCMWCEQVNDPLWWENLRKKQKGSGLLGRVKEKHTGGGIPFEP